MNTTDNVYRLLTFFRTTTFRLAVLFAAGLGLSCLLLFAFIYWQTAIVERQRVDHLLMRDAEIMASQPLADLRQSVEDRVSADFHRIVYAALFDGSLHLIAGNLPDYPANLPTDGSAHPISVGISPSRRIAVVQMVARPLPGAEVLVIGRNIDSLGAIEGVVVHALTLGIVPVILLALIGGIILGHRAQRRFQAIQSATERIGLGELQARLPTRGSGDEFDHLVGSVNHMLDDLGRMFDQVKTESDHMAHDLRTPLTQIMTRLERACETAETHEDLRDKVDRAVEGLGQALQCMTALLRISRIEAGHCQDGFADVDLGSIIEAVADLYSPVAEERGLLFTHSVGVSALLHGDGDLLREAIANLVDNAIKYTPAGGHVRLAVERRGNAPVIVVADDGIGIAPGDRTAIMHRHYRSDWTHHIEGYGLGLSLVDAILRLHDFALVLKDGNPGTVFEVFCASQKVRRGS